MPIPKSTSGTAPDLFPSSELDIHISIALATGDYNFDDFAYFTTAADKDIEMKVTETLTLLTDNIQVTVHQHLSVVNLLNPSINPSTDNTCHHPLEDMDVSPNNMPVTVMCSEESDITTKRKRVAHTDNNSNTYSDLASGSESVHKHLRGNSTSKSAMLSMAKRLAFKASKSQIDDTALETWKKAISTDDPFALFDLSNICNIQHSTCGKTSWSNSRWI